MKPLLEGPFGGLDDLFEDFLYIPAITARRGNVIYPSSPGWYFLSGLPGSLRPGAALYVKPWPHVVQAAQPRMTNNVIGSFRAIQSAHWMKQGRLPVFVTDTHHIASPLLAFVPQTEHERFNRES